MTEKPKSKIPVSTERRLRDERASSVAPFRNRSGVLVGVACLALILFAVGALLLAERHRGDLQAASAPSGIGGPFTLVDGDGRQVTDRDFRGKYLLVYFGYTSCPDVCPTTLNEVAAAMEKLGPKAARVQPLFITVDPERDTPDVMKRYAAAFSPRIVGLTGTPEEIASVSREYRVYYAAHRTGNAQGDYTVDHSSILYLMGPDGRFVAPIRTDEMADEMAADVSKNLS
jgi:protein SCO1/2